MPLQENRDRMLQGISMAIRHRTSLWMALLDIGSVRHAEIQIPSDGSAQPTTGKIIVVASVAGTIRVSECAVTRVAHIRARAPEPVELAPACERDLIGLRSYQYAASRRESVVVSNTDASPLMTIRQIDCPDHG